MAYTKLDVVPPNLESTLGELLQQQRVADPLQAMLMPELLAAGRLVELDDGIQVWVGCVLHDNPLTPQVDFATVAFALQDGQPWRKSNGQLVCLLFWHGVLPDTVPVLGVAPLRTALSMIALGEPQPQRAIEPPAADGPTETDLIALPYVADRCIRTYIAAAQELAVPLTDVL